MVHIKQTKRKRKPAREKVEAACVDAAPAAPAHRDYEGWRALFAAASPVWLNDQRLVLRANERAGMHEYARALREALAAPRP